jgi:hypothetical protein
MIYGFQDYFYLLFLAYIYFCLFFYHEEQFEVANVKKFWCELPYQAKQNPFLIMDP